MKSSRGATAFNFSIPVFLIVFNLLVALSLWTERNLEFWLSRYKGSEVDLPFWMSAVLSVVLSVIVVAANIVSEILRMAMFS
jgi:hypothetical protein